jgi:hypothetical protein
MSCDTAALVAQLVEHQFSSVGSASSSPGDFKLLTRILSLCRKYVKIFEKNQLNHECAHVVKSDIKTAKHSIHYSFVKHQGEGGGGRVQTQANSTYLKFNLDFIHHMMKMLASPCNLHIVTNLAGHLELAGHLKKIKSR